MRGRLYLQLGSQTQARPLSLDQRRAEPLFQVCALGRHLNLVLLTGG
jgi:hypothetical protein